MDVCKMFSQDIYMAFTFAFDLGLNSKPSMFCVVFLSRLKTLIWRSLLWILMILSSQLSWVNILVPSFLFHTNNNGFIIAILFPSLIYNLEYGTQPGMFPFVSTANLVLLGFFCCQSLCLPIMILITKGDEIKKGYHGLIVIFP